MRRFTICSDENHHILSGIRMAAATQGRDYKILREAGYALAGVQPSICSHTPGTWKV